MDGSSNHGPVDRMLAVDWLSCLTVHKFLFWLLSCSLISHFPLFDILFVTVFHFWVFQLFKLKKIFIFIFSGNRIGSRWRDEGNAATILFR
jgi:hypothetical protein